MTVNELMHIQYYLSQGPVAKLPGSKFAYAAHKNVSKIRTAIKEAEFKCGIDKKKENEARKAREDMKMEFCEKNEDGSPKIEEGKYVGLDDNEEFEKAWEALHEEHKEINEAREKFMQNEVEFTPHMVTIENLPEGMTTEMMEMVGFMIEGGEDE